MEEVLVETWSGRNKTKLFQAILLEGKYAIFSRMGIVEMMAVEPTGGDGIYKPTESRHNYTLFLGTGGRSISALKRYAKRILEMSAFELLTKHYDPVEEVFFILSDKKPNF
ncbi:MAG TPA: hypothetical protein VEZ13_13475 [Brevibacillus sp.]|nr:hypothetical protein [Brevibacillus sp.]